ncbi:hypothetical protein JW877_06985 [bacterium]|nr:hypothetical protein [bacterium]
MFKLVFKLKGRLSKPGNAALDTGWVIANHILVSFHVAFISSVLSIANQVSNRGDVLRFMFASPETIISLLFLYITFHTGIAIHEMGHYLKAVKLNALCSLLLDDAQSRIESGFLKKFFWYVRMFITIPYGAFPGVKKNRLDYHPDAPYNLAVAAAGPRASRNLSSVFLPLAIVLLIVGLISKAAVMVYLGRLCLGIGIVGLLDFLMADPGKYREFRERESKAKKASEKAGLDRKAGSFKWVDRVEKVKKLMIYTRMKKVILSDGNEKWVPWEFRNCGMGGRHTEKEFPESNISLQESMFIPLSARNYEDAQEMTVNLQTRLKEIIENSEGCIVKGVGTEGGLAPFIRKEPGDILPVQRLWRMQKQAILDCGYIPGKDVAMALDPAASEAETAYREEKGLTGEEGIGIYMAWRDSDKTVLSRDQLLEIYHKAIEEDDLPIVSIEDGFAEDDDEGWWLIMKSMGDKIHVIGDDNITTKDSSIEEKAEKGLINTALIKLNQIGSVTEGVLALLTAIGKKLETVVSHRSKSPIEDFEAQVALAINSLGLKAGGGANSERLYKYESVVKVIQEALRKQARKDNEKPSDHEIQNLGKNFIERLTITSIVAREASTNAGIPTVAVDLKVGIPNDPFYERLLTFEGATPLGTSAGTDEAIHLIDSIIPAGEPIVKKFPELFKLQVTDKTYRFKKEVTDDMIASMKDKELSELWHRAKRYNGKGCLNAVDNVGKILSPLFLGKKVSELGEIMELDRTMLQIECDLARQRGTIAPDATQNDNIKVMQRKINLGMNAVLSMSLALARLKGALHGQELCEVMQEQMTEAMSRVFAFNGGSKLLDRLSEKLATHQKEKTRFEKLIELENQCGRDIPMNEVKLSAEEEQKIIDLVQKIVNDIKETAGSDNVQFAKVLKDKLNFEQLSLGLQIIDEVRQEVPLYELIREQLPVYKLK